MHPGIPVDKGHFTLHNFLQHILSCVVHLSSGIKVGDDENDDDDEGR